MGDVVEHGSQGLVGVLVVQPRGATYWNENGTTVSDGFGTRAIIKVPTGTAVAPGTVMGTRNGGANSFRENVLVYQDGLNLRLRANGNPAAEIPQHYVGDDSYDMGDRGMNYGTEPLWSRVNFAGQGANCQLSVVVADDINPCRLQPSLMLDDDPLLPANLRGMPVSTPVFTADANDSVRFRVAHPDGRARQHSFRLTGHSYADMGIENFVNPGASLIAPGKGVTANLYSGAQRGYWMFQDGPTSMVSTGMWGLFKVR
jgi:hypothetical protein